MKHVTIVGFGGFGKTLYRLIHEDFQITIYGREKISFEGIPLDDSTVVTNSIEEAYRSDTVFFAVPISAFESIIQEHKAYFREGQTLIDVLSVKVHPEAVLSRELHGSDIQALLTHPTFGPDSSKDGFSQLPFIMDKFLCNDDTYAFWKEYFSKKGLRIIEMSPSEHDKMAANSQGLTHFIGRLLERMEFTGTPIDSLGSKKLQEIKEQTCHDTWQLFHDLQTYNPYTKDMRLHLSKAYDELYDKLLPERVHPKYFVYGIQGGIGGFNEQALMHYLDKKYSSSEERSDESSPLRSARQNYEGQGSLQANSSHALPGPMAKEGRLRSNNTYKIDYLFTTERVLKSIHEGTIDFGLFAISNSSGGLVEESMQAMTHYRFSIVKDFEILIKHFLMKRKDATADEIDTIMAHPQVLKQCEQTLAKKFSHFTLKSGEGDLVDTAKAAEQLSKKQLPKNVAILGPVNLADRYGFDIIAENLQDKKDNYTRFLLVKRYVL